MSKCCFCSKHELVNNDDMVVIIDYYNSFHSQKDAVNYILLEIIVSPYFTTIHA